MQLLNLGMRLGSDFLRRSVVVDLMAMLLDDIISIETDLVGVRGLVFNFHFRT